MHVVVCDDNREQADIYSQMIQDILNELGEESTLKSYYSEDAILFQMEEEYSKVDLVYLGIHMPGLNGLHIAESLRNMGYVGDIIFHADNPDYAIDGYDWDALHYIVKGATDRDKFKKILGKACKRKKKREQEVIILSCAGDTRCIPLEDIRYFEIQSRLVTVFYEEEKFEFYSTMAKLEEQLFGKGFQRVHRSYLVNSDYIAKLTTRECLLTDESVLPVGRSYVAKQ